MMCTAALSCQFFMTAALASATSVQALSPRVNQTNSTSDVTEIATPTREPIRPSEHAASSTSTIKPTDQERQVQWFDVWQHNFTESMDFTVRQLDGLFSADDVTTQAAQTARAEGRILLSWEPRSGKLSDTDLRFRIRVRLPALEERVDLLLSDNEDATQDNTVRAARNTDNDNRDRTTISLRFRPEQNSHYSYRIGAGRRDQLYVKGRFRDAFTFNEKWALLYDAELYYYTRDRLGAETGFTLQYEINDKHLLRQNNRFYFRDDSNDWLWRHEIHHLFAMNEHNAFIPHFMVEGITQPNHQVKEVYAGLRWRNNALRDWLVFEIEPFTLWLRDEDFSPSFGVAMRIEAYYGKP